MAHGSVQDRTFHLLFVGFVAAVYATALAVAGLLPTLEHASVVAIGVTLDLVVVVPLAFYLLVVRRRGLPILALAPILVLSIVAAARILPRDHQQTLRTFEILLVPLELGLIGWIGWRAATALRRARRDSTADPLEQLQRAALELLRHERAASIFASEIAVLYYAIGSWRARPNSPAGATAFTHHERSGHGGIVLAVLLLVAVEGLAMHFLIARWSGVVAWVFTISSAYAALWLIADYRATVLRPILVDDDDVSIRAGLRWSLRLRRAQVAGVDRKQPEFGKECLNLTFLGTPTHWITLAEPMLVQGPYGLRRRVRALGCEPDASEEFGRVLGSRPS